MTGGNIGFMSARDQVNVSLAVRPIDWVTIGNLLGNFGSFVTVRPCGQTSLFGIRHSRVIKILVP